MKRGLVFVLCLLLLGCSREITKPGKLSSSSKRSAADNFLLNQWQASGLTDSISTLLGWPDYQQARQVTISDGSDALLIPLEAEDELRFLICLFQDQQVSAATCMGWSQTNWFSVVRAETLSTYEGWLYFYDLRTGQRCLSRYYEARQLLQHDEYFPVSALTFDLLGRQTSFQWLELETMRTPSQPTPRIFLQTEIEAVISMITPQLALLAQSRQI